MYKVNALECWSFELNFWLSCVRSFSYTISSSKVQLGHIMALIENDLYNISSDSNKSF